MSTHPSFVFSKSFRDALVQGPAKNTILQLPYDVLYIIFKMIGEGHSVLLGLTCRTLWRHFKDYNPIPLPIPLSTPCYDLWPYNLMILSHWFDEKTLFDNHHRWKFYDKLTRHDHGLRFLNNSIYGDGSKESDAKNVPLAHLKSRLRDFHLSKFQHFDWNNGRSVPAEEFRLRMMWQPLLPCPNGLGESWNELALKAIQEDMDHECHGNVPEVSVIQRKKNWEKY